MKLGLHMPTMDWEGGPPQLGNTLGRVVQTAEEAGFDNHLVKPVELDELSKILDAVPAQ